MAAPQLVALSSIISTGVETIASVYSQHSATYPSLDDAYANDPVNDPRVAEAARLIVAAAAQLIASVRVPQQIVNEGAVSTHFTSALATVSELNVAEILRDVGPKGLHISEIAERANTDPSKLARILRFLATRHIFREVTPNVFATNRISAVIDTGLSLDAIQANPAGKYVDGKQSIAALIGLLTEEAAKSALYTPALMQDPVKASSEDARVTPFGMAFNTSATLFEWLEQPGNETRLTRFGIAMSGTSAMGRTETIVNAFDWAGLPNDSVVVDVGGGVGSVTLALAKAHPHLKYTIEDREAVVPKGKEFWSAHYPTALSSGLVQYKAHDFFDAQPVMNASVFILRHILHDWPKKDCRTILKHLRAAARSSTTLIVMDQIVPYASPASGEVEHVPGAATEVAPWPLLPNFGEGFVHSADLQMLALLNAQERTIGEFIELVDGTGWKLDRVDPGHGAMSHLIFGTV